VGENLLLLPPPPAAAAAAAATTTTITTTTTTTTTCLSHNLLAGTFTVLAIQHPNISQMNEYT
jgi:hypothetical protein